jgi:hypothetical protein
LKFIIEQSFRLILTDQWGEIVTCSN